MSATPTEKLIVNMLANLFRELKLEGDTDHDLIERAVLNDELWVLEHKYPGLGLKVENPPEVAFVFNVLDMFGCLKDSWERLNQEEQDQLISEHPHIQSWIKYRGFDGNNENEYLSIASNILDELQLFRYLGVPGDLNSHSPMVDIYRGMLEAFEPIRNTLHGRRLSPDEIVEIYRS